MPDHHPLPQRQVYTVSRLNRECRSLLEGGFPLIWLEGEVSNLARPGSGHLYFSLKDAQAQVRCALFRGRAQLLQSPPRNGQQVLVRARVSLYEARGEFQLIVEHLEPAGEGALRAAFDALCRRLTDEGLFDPAHKRPLPRFPRRVGVVTSPTGAALRDVLSVLRRRFPGLPVRVYPTPVQGIDAAPGIQRALALASQRRDCDVLLLVRGGGSLEDLWPFNEEGVARAIRAATVPVISGVGHETDVTIADFAADLRAPTPSAAAEHASPDRTEWLTRLEQLNRRLSIVMARGVTDRAQRLDWLMHRLEGRHPGRRLQDRARRLDELRLRLVQAQARHLERLGVRLEADAARLTACTPRRRLRHLDENLTALQGRLTAAARRRLERLDDRLEGAGRALNAVNPLNTLDRGYAVLRRPDGTVLRGVADTHPGDGLEAVLRDGRLLCRVESIVPNPGQAD